MVRSVIQREIQYKKDISDDIGFGAACLHDPSAGKRYPDVQTPLYLPPCSPGISVGEKRPYASGVLGIYAAQYTCGDTSDCSPPKAAWEKQENICGDMCDHELHFRLWVRGVYKAWLSRIYVREDRICVF